MTVAFMPKFGKPLSCVIQYELNPTMGKTLVKIGTDPFSTYVSTNQLAERDTMSTATANTEDAAPKRRGRPPKSAAVVPIESARKHQAATSATKVATPKPAAKTPVRASAAPKATVTTKRPVGRPRKAVAPPVEAPKRRGRPPKAATAAPVPTPKTTVAKRAPVAKATAKRAAAPKRQRVTENPFRPESNSYLFCNALLKGGTRRRMAESLAKKIEIKPWSKEGVDQIEEIDTRLNLTANKLQRDYGWKIERTGRGLSGKIKITP